MKNKEKVSIIMPAYNSGKTIRDSIDSVIAQSYSNWELLVIDDGSSDDTVAVVESIGLVNIKLLRNIYAKGAAGARKTGIEYSDSRFVAFLDSDDIWDDRKLEKQLDFMSVSGAAFVYSDYSTFKDKASNIITIVKTPKKISYNDLIKSCMIGCLTVVLDRTAFDKFDFPITPKEDYAFWLKLLKQVEYAYRVPDTNSSYRLSSNSLSGKKIKEIRKQWIVVYCIEKTPLFKSLYYMACYALSGVIKHYVSARVLK
ncbi:TPA: glycosyltransferase family 2 protein [Vibrio vulnificus]|nr:glycosyltransferase family 2 protein [Vibrio vulnificus]